MGRHDPPENRVVEKSTLRSLKDGTTVRLDFVTNIEHMDKHCYQSDGVEAYINGKKSGYIKFDYSLMRWFNEYPTNYHIRSQWSGTSFIYPMEMTDTYDTVSFDRLVSWAKNAIHYFRYAPKITKAHPICDALIAYPPVDVSERRAEIVAMLMALDASEYMKEALESPVRSIQFFMNKPFVAHSNVSENKYQGVMSDNRGRGLGMLLYREAANWIIETGIGPGLYASTNQTDEAALIWQVLEERGWVHKDADRRYLGAQ